MNNPFGIQGKSDCEKCHGAGMYHDSDKMHAFPCDLCCSHPKWNVLTGAIWGRKEGMLCCQPCGALKGTPENEKLVQMHKDIINNSDDKETDSKLLASAYLITTCRYCEAPIVVEGLYANRICNKLSCYRARYRDLPVRLPDNE